MFWKEGERIAREQETGSFVQGFAYVLVCFVCVLVGICVWEESFSREFFICEGERGKKAPRRGYGRVILILSKISGKHHTRTQKHFSPLLSHLPILHLPSSIRHPPSASELRWMMLSGDSGVEGSRELVRDPRRVLIYIRTGVRRSKRAPRRVICGAS